RITIVSSIGASSLQKITNRKTGALSIDSLNCLIYQIFQKSKTRCAPTLKAASRLRRQSNHTWRRKCGLPFFGCNRFENFGDASLAKDMSSNYNKSFRTPGCSIPRHCNNMRSSHGWELTTGAKRLNSPRDIEILLWR